MRIRTRDSRDSPLVKIAGSGIIFFVNTRSLACVLKWMAVAVAGFALNAGAEAVRNGNEVARDYSLADAAGKKDIQKKATGVYHTFRFLLIKDIVQPSEGNRAAKLTTVEPSSDMKVIVVTDAKLSLQIAKTLGVGDCVAVRGRIKSVAVDDANTIVVDPAILQFKDKAQPKPGKELLKEVDPKAF